MRNLSVGLAVSLLITACGGGGGGSTNNSTNAVPASVNSTAQISVNNKEILKGDNVTITWSSTNANTCTASGDWSGTKATTGSESVSASKESNTFTITCGGTSASTTVNTFLYQTTVTTSDLPNYTSSVVTKDDLLTGMTRGVSSTTFIRGQDGKMRIFMFPSLFYNGEPMPAFELTETSTNKFGSLKWHSNVRLGFGVANTLINNNKEFVIVDQGLENTPDFKALPHGHVWIAKDSGSGFTFTQVSTNKAFYHNVAAADITGDKKDDLLVVNMGVNDPNANPNTLYAYHQTDNGAFVQDKTFAPETLIKSLQDVGSGSVAAGDLDGDGTVEIVHANYKSYVTPNWGAFRIFQKNYLGNHKVVKTYQREGAFNYAGAYSTHLVDYDNDKDLDIIFALEGNMDPNDNKNFTMNAIEIYRNDGNFVFTRITESVLSKYIWDNVKDMYWRQLSIIDINNDGYLDIFLQHGGFGNRLNTTSIDLGKMVLRNDQGKGYTSLEGSQGLTVTFANFFKVPESFRIMDRQNNTTRIFGFDREGVPTIIEMRVGK